jgi:hypothetical protein
MTIANNYPALRSANMELFGGEWFHDRMPVENLDVYAAIQVLRIRREKIPVRSYRPALTLRESAAALKTIMKLTLGDEEN